MDCQVVMRHKTCAERGTIPTHITKKVFVLSTITTRILQTKTTSMAKYWQSVSVTSYLPLSNTHSEPPICAKRHLLHSGYSSQR